jgi:hypothetical protein
MSVGREIPNRVYMKGGLFVRSEVDLIQPAMDVFWRVRGSERFLLRVRRLLNKSLAVRRWRGFETELNRY